MEDELMLAEIEKIFGKPTRMSLFYEDEESYNVFRQSIIDAPLCFYDNTMLPFTDIRMGHFLWKALKFFLSPEAKKVGF